MGNSIVQAGPSAVSSRTESISGVIAMFASTQDVAPSSRDLYSRTVSLFFDWVGQTGRSIDSLTIQDIIAYKESLLASGKSALTAASYINSLRRFYTWAEASKIYPNIAQAVHAPKRKQEFRKRPLSVTQVGNLLSSEREKSQRDFAIINLCVRTGLRCIEVVRANVSDITYIGDSRVLMVRGKGKADKDNFVILPDSVYNPIAEYLKARGTVPANAPLFTSESNRNTGGRLTTRTVSGIAKGALREIGLDSHVFTAHSLRHTVGTNILRAGGTLEQAQMTLRHSNPATTEIYARMALQERRFTNGGEALIDKLYSSIS